MRLPIWLIIITTAFFLSCNQSKKDSVEKLVKHKTESKEDTIKNLVKFSINPNIFQLSNLPDTVRVKITNNTNGPITTGLEYCIEVYKMKEWHRVSPKEPKFLDIGFILKNNDYKQFEKSLLKDIINYKKGKYRIVKYYLKTDYQKTKEKNILYAEFNIE